ncbi:MAG: LytTR family DNA-binding domain-containing protein [Actinomycetota bacterium]
MRVLLVDDEEPARRRLRRLLADALPGAELLQAPDAASAETLLTEGVDLVFMDISMPGESGMSLTRRQPGAAPVIFVTAHSSYAVEAFEAHAVDYLLKPVSIDRLRQALDRLRHDPGGSAGTGPAMLAVRSQDRTRFFPVDEVTRVWASHKYTRFEHLGTEYSLDESLASLEHRIPQFLRVHRSHLVNAAFVSEIERADDGVAIRLTTGVRVPVSRRYLRAAKRGLGA